MFDNSRPAPLVESTDWLWDVRFDLGVTKDMEGYDLMLLSWDIVDRYYQSDHIILNRLEAFLLVVRDDLRAGRDEAYYQAEADKRREIMGISIPTGRRDESV